MALKYLIVQLPGIGGSVLARDGMPVWDLTAAKVARTLCMPDVVALGDEDLEPVGLVDTMTVVPGLFAVPGYDGMIANLRRWFGASLRVADYREGVPVAADTDVLRVPYDFRRSVAVGAARLARAVESTDAARRGVVVLAHSMGGLVARHWIATLGGAEWCRALITLGTPYRGAPRMLDVLVNGLAVGRWRHPAATQVIRQWPGAYELLPQYPAVQAADTVLEPAELPLQTVRSFGDPDAAARLTRMARDAAAVHMAMDRGWGNGVGPEVIPFYARGHRTPNWAGLVGGRLEVTTADPVWRGNVGWFGDGTVPMISAIPPELSERPGRWHGLVDKHGAMAATVGVGELLMCLMGSAVPRRGGEQPDRPWLGFDVDDVVWAGDECRVVVEVLGDVEAPGTASLVTIAGVSTRMQLRDGRWEASLPGLAAGAYDMVVEVKAADHGSSVWGQVPLAVTERGDDWERIDDDEGAL